MQVISNQCACNLYLKRNTVFFASVLSRPHQTQAPPDMGGVWRGLVVVVAVLGQSEGFLEWLEWSDAKLDLCKEVCSCPKDLVSVEREGIDCVDRNLTYIQGGIDIPKVFTKISFARNHIKSIAADTFSPSSSLVSLDISENYLESLPGRPFANLYILSSLNLRNNLISNVDAEAFGGLQNLTQLDISYNRIGSLPEKIFGELTSLQELNMGFNPLGELHEGLLQHTPALRTLDLSKLNLKSIPDNFFMANLTKLESVSLAHNLLRVVPSKALHGLSSSLLHLDLSGNLFTSLSAYSFYGLGNLRSLSLEQMLRLTRIDAYAFGDLMHLEKIVLRYIPWIERIDYKAFHKTENGVESPIILSDFTFSYTSLHTLPEDLLPWEDLHYISLEFNHWRCDCNMLWVKNATSLLHQTGNRMICYEPSHLRGYRLTHAKDKDLTCDSSPSTTRGAFGFLVVVMIAGLSASLATISLLVYWQRGWVCRQPPGAYTSVRRSGSTITITEEVDTTSEA
ncbi:hypothetical protein O3P69_005501 [Scylla paramamosain]|uniref:LRRCT domain-containing protein n=2 Tax=Scylla paramamosain TaxID=85552 RepID=A0AAW0U9N9_SCYPA